MKVWLSAGLVAATIVTAGTSALAQAPPPTAGTGASRVAFVDVQRVLARSVAGVAAREQLEREKATMLKEL
jgi:Skp family chaperone for outer membrane proteins